MYRLASEYPYQVPYKKNPYSQEMIDAVVNYLKEGAKLQHYRKGEECALFEKEFAQFCGRKFAISTISGTASLPQQRLALTLPYSTPYWLLA